MGKRRNKYGAKPNCRYTNNCNYGGWTPTKWRWSTLGDPSRYFVIVSTNRAKATPTDLT